MLLRHTMKAELCYVSILKKALTQRQTMSHFFFNNVTQYENKSVQSNFSETRFLFPFWHIYKLFSWNADIFGIKRRGVMM